MINTILAQHDTKQRASRLPTFCTHKTQNRPFVSRDEFARMQSSIVALHFLFMYIYIVTDDPTMQVWNDVHLQPKFST